ncbi:MAG TPA: thiamine pyrophosphate-dependent enzyme [Chloroflexota bacterium]|nr:thiamine pyrophosphate-dependent enzyme [Chloroflexota bacterium]
MSMNRKDPTEALAALRGDAITITTEQCIKAWREAVPDALDDPTHVDVVGAMGSASSIALGIALAQPNRKVIVMDGDGSLLMQLGSLVTIAGAAPENLVHIVFENGVYATSGGQPLPAEGRLDFEVMARGAGFAHAARYDDAAAFKADLPGLLERRGPVFVTLQIEHEVGVPSGTRSAMMGQQLEALRKQLADAAAD